jgi:putative ABC transport system permease protein
VETFVGDREGAIVGADTAKRFGWKVGDRVPIKGTIFVGTWEFNIDGIYTGLRKGDDLTQFWFHYKYLDERRQFGKGLIGWYTVKLETPDDAVRVAKAIDDQFANSPYETKTDTEKAFAISFAKQTGNIEFLMLAIGGVVFFTLLLVTGNTMAIAVRERVNELAVLKAVGFTDRFVLLLVLGESCLIAFVGGALGVALCKLMTLGGDPTRGLLPFFYLPPSAMLAGIGIALVFGFLAGILPAASAMRLRVVDALRRV